MTFGYATRVVTVGALTHEAQPDQYDLCHAHADRMAPPNGWELRDERREHDDAAPTNRTVALGGAGTVAVLAAALGRSADPPRGDLDGDDGDGTGPAPDPEVRWQRALFEDEQGPALDW